MLYAVVLVLMAAQAPGIAPDWELKPRVEKIPSEVARLRPLLDQLQPEKWTAAGAPAAYEKQWKLCLEGIDGVANAAARLAEQPSKLSLAVETSARLESLIQFGTSVSQAVRRYQNPAVADLLDSELNAAGASREWLRQHMMDLANLRENELDVAEKEAQRCRAQLARPGAKK